MTTTNLATKLAEATAAISHIPKRGKNTQQGYDYVTDADVLDTIRTQLSARKVATTVGINNVEHVPFTTAKGSPMFLTTVSGDLSFIDGETGEVIAVPFWGVGSDSTDKGYYKAVTGGVKYALLKNLLVPTGDDPERDEAAERKPGATAPTNPPASSPFTGDVKKTPDVKVGLTEPQRKKLFARFDELGLTVTGSKRYVITALTGKHSTKEMSGSDLDKILTFFAEKSDATEDMVVKAMAAA